LLQIKVKVAEFDEKIAELTKKRDEVGRFERLFDSHALAK
jgi:hypothetical protein